MAGVSLDGGGEAGQAVLHHLGCAGGAGREHDPFGLPRRAAILGPRREGRAAGDRESDTRDTRLVHRGTHERIDPGIGDHGRKVFGRHVRRTQDEPTRDAIELDQRSAVVS